MKRIVVFFFTVFFFAVSAGAQGQGQGCYQSKRTQAIREMRQKNYQRAIELIDEAKDCYDKPSSNDLESIRQDCLKAMKGQKVTGVAPQGGSGGADLPQRGYIDITRVTFANVDRDGNIISDYGSPLYKQEMKYLKPKIYYTGLASESRSVEFKVKIYNPDGTMESASNSPSGYTMSDTRTVYPGSSQSITLSGWGNNTGGTSYSAGNVRYEIWCNGYLLYTATAEIKDRPGYASYLTVDNQTAISTSFSASGGTETFYVSTDGSWTTWGVPSWCSVEDKTSTSFRLRCDPNTSSSSRSDYMKVKAGDREVRIDITQPSASRSANALSRGDWRSMMKRVMSNATINYSGSAFKGQASYDDPDGMGVYWWDNDDFCWGKWVDGTRNGMAIYIANENATINNCPDCVYFVGNYTDNRKSGEGTCYDEYGNLIYYGDFSANAPVGTYPTSGYESYKFECIEYVSGAMYVGETKDGERHGRGIIMWTNGDAWYGPWSEGSRSGVGIYLYADGTVSYGRWSGDDYTAY